MAIKIIIETGILNNFNLQLSFDPNDNPHKWSRADEAQKQISQARYRGPRLLRTTLNTVFGLIRTNLVLFC